VLSPLTRTAAIAPVGELGTESAASPAGSAPGGGDACPVTLGIVAATSLRTIVPPSNPAGAADAPPPLARVSHDGLGGSDL
jgi:hypothetical protein